MDEKAYDNLLLMEMNFIKLKNRECGIYNGVYKYNTLNGIWFEKAGLSVPKEDSSKSVKKNAIYRDSVVSIE